jgi:hypothetical protein
MKYQRTHPLDPNDVGDTKFARIFYPDGRVYCYKERYAYNFWLALPTGTKAAFRCINDMTPVYSHDYVDVV